MRASIGWRKDSWEQGAQGAHDMAGVKVGLALTKGYIVYSVKVGQRQSMIFLESHDV